MIQDGKQSELNGAQRSSTDPSAQHRSMNTRALVVAPTDDLFLQLAGLANNVRLRRVGVLCASRAITSSRKSISVPKMA